MLRTAAGLALLLALAGCANQYDADSLDFDEASTINTPDPNPGPPPDPNPEPEPDLNPDPEPGNGICNSIEPCGGTLEGVFLFADTCADAFSLLSPIAESCPETTINSVASISGQVTYQRSGTWQEQLRLTVDQTVQIPLGCVGTQEACDDLTCNNAQACRETFAAQSAECRLGNNGQTCDCDVLIEINQQSTGRFTTNNGRLTQTFDGSGQTFSGTYCQQGNTLDFEADTGQRTRLTRL